MEFHAIRVWNLVNMIASKVLLLLVAAVVVLAQDEPMEESRMFQDDNAEEARELQDALESRMFQDENMEEARALDDDNAEEARVFQDDEAEEVARSLDDSQDDSRDARQLDYVRPIKRKSFFGRFSRPTMTSRCRKAGNMVMKDDCTSYLSCSSRFFGMYKTCPKDELFDAVELKCRSANKVSCRL